MARLQARGLAPGSGDIRLVHSPDVATSVLVGGGELAPLVEPGPSGGRGVLVSPEVEPPSHTEHA